MNRAVYIPAGLLESAGTGVLFVIAGALLISMEGAMAGSPVLLESAGTGAPFVGVAFVVISAAGALLAGVGAVMSGAGAAGAELVLGLAIVVSVSALLLQPARANGRLKVTAATMEYF
jgi:hypothetical protein